MALLPLLAGIREKISCASLPVPGWLWEQFIAEDTPDKKFVFHGIEGQPDKFQEMVKTVGQIQPGHPNATFIPEGPMGWVEFLQQQSRASFDLLYADYMGFFGAEKTAEIELMLRRRILRPGGFFLFTVSMNGRNSSWHNATLKLGKQHPEIYVNDAFAEAKEAGVSEASPNTVVRCRGTAAMIQDIAESCGQKLRQVSTHLYYNKHKDLSPTPEVSICFRLLV